MTSRLPFPTAYKKTKDGRTKISPVMSCSNIPMSIAMVSCCGGYPIATRMPLSEKQVAMLKAAQEKLDADAATLNEARRSIDSKDTVGKGKEELASGEMQTKKTKVGSWLSRFKK